MKKKDLLKKIKEETELKTQQEAEEFLDGVVEAILSGLEEDGKVKVENLGTFTLKERKARKARNPRTGEEIDVPSRKVIKFKVDKCIEDEMNE